MWDRPAPPNQASPKPKAKSPLFKSRKDPGIHLIQSPEISSRFRIPILRDPPKVNRQKEDDWHDTPPTQDLGHRNLRDPLIHSLPLLR